MSRTSNSLRNVGSTVGGQMLNSILRFACRTVFLHTLGQEFLGISSLYSNVISLLNISELGLSTAITFSLYKPLADNDRQAIRAIMGFFRTAYRIIALVILGAGLMLMPALPYLMTGVTDKVNIYHFYLLYLTETVVSYLFFSYKSVLLIASQKKYIVDLVMYGCQTVVNLLQMAVLIFWKSFLLYMVLLIVNHVVFNIITACLVDYRYPWLRGKAPKLPKEEKKAIFTRIYATGLNKISVAVGTSTDNLVISSFVSVVAVGLYSNYAMVVQVFQKLLSGVFQAVGSSLGNLYATESRQRSAYMFRCLNLLNNYLITLCSVCFLVMFQPFVQLWAGEDYLLSYGVVISIVLNFATNYLQNVVQIYREACGTFTRGKYRPIFTALLNLIISVVLVRWFGIGGVLWGSIISRMITAWWFDAWLLHRAAFGISPWGYYGQCGITLGLCAACTAFMHLIFCKISHPSWGMLILMGLISAGTVTAVYLLIYGTTPEFAYLKKKGLHLLQRQSS